MPTKLQALLELLELQWQKCSFFYSHEEEKRKQLKIQLLSLHLVICL